MVLSKEELEELRKKPVKDWIAYGSTLGKDLEISKTIGKWATKPIKWIKSLFVKNTTRS